MTPTEIILLVIAIVILVLSFVIVDRSNSLPSGGKSEPGNGNAPVLTEKDIKELRKQAAQLLETAVSDSVIEADDKMSKISNEKIMAVNEFSSQLLEKIEQNNEQVVFLYNMLTQKEEEIKATYAKMDTIRRENKEFLEKLSTLMSAKAKSKQPAKDTGNLSSAAFGQMKKDNTQSNQANADGKSLSGDTAVNQQANGLRMEEETKNEPASPADASDARKHDSFFEQLQFDEAAVAMEEEKVNKNEQILALHKQKKSILEISRELNLGQGEVKLVIDLYGR